MARFIDKLQHYIENTLWDGWIMENDRCLEGFCIAVIIVSALYFGIFTIIGFMRMR